MFIYPLESNLYSITDWNLIPFVDRSNEIRAFYFFLMCFEKKKTMPHIS